MSSKWHEKKKKIEEYEFEKALLLSPDDTTDTNVAKDAAMGKGEDELFEKKLSKEEKKARAKAAREAKKKKKKGDEADADAQDEAPNAADVLNAAKETLSGDPTAAIQDDGVDHEKVHAHGRRDQPNLHHDQHEYAKPQTKVVGAHSEIKD